MKNNETQANAQLTDKNKSLVSKSYETLIENQVDQISNNGFKSPRNQSDLASSNAKENQKLNYNLSENENNYNNSKESEININSNAFKRNSNLSINGNIPNLNLNPQNMNITNNLSTVNSPNFSNFVSTEAALDSANKGNGSLVHSEFANLLKLNNALNKYLSGSNNRKQQQIENNSNNGKSFRSRNANNSVFKYGSNKHFFNTTQSPNQKRHHYYDLEPKKIFANKNAISQSTNLQNNNLNPIKNNSHSMQKNETDVNLINLDKYSNILNQTMLNYKIESKPNENMSNNISKINEAKEDIFQTHNKTLAFSSFNRSLNSKMINNSNIIFGENSLIKIDVKDKDFSNPLDSGRIIHTNKSIYDNISTSLINIQKIYYDKTINGIEKFHESKKKMCKVRISNIMPKNEDISKLFKAKDSLAEAEKNQKNSEVNLNKININNKTNEYFPDENDLNSEFKNEKDFLNERTEKEKERESALEKERNRIKKQKDEIGVKFRNRIPNLLEKELYAFYKYSAKNFPECREQFAFDFNEADLVLFGGIVTNKNNHVWTLDPVSFEWQKRNSDNIPTYPRYGHTGITFQKKLYVFGGKCKSNNYHYIADLDIFDLKENQWFTPNFSSKSSQVELRRNHVADLIGSQMIIHGGFSEENKLLGEAHVLSLSSLKWSQIIISELTPGPFLGGHASALALPFEIKSNFRTSLYRFPDNVFGKAASNRIRERGWYLFGGINTDEGTLSNDLWILRLGRKPLEWIKPNVRGKPPLPRYSHTLNFYEEGNFLICHGGRNDLSSESFALNDTHIFDLYKMEWSEMKLYSDSEKFNVFNRCGHNSVLFNNQLIIFGGMNNLNYIGSSFLIINLDFNYKLQKEAEGNNKPFDLNYSNNKGHLKNKQSIHNSKSLLEKEEKEVILPPIK